MDKNSYLINAQIFQPKNHEIISESFHFFYFLNNKPTGNYNLFLLISNGELQFIDLPKFLVPNGQDFK
jgi:hypothetical protein